MNVEGWTCRCEYIRCGKETCRSCPHGPYWYGYRRYNGKMKKRYFGKKPPSPSHPRSDPRSDRKPHRFDDIFDRRKATAALALEIMGITGRYTISDLKRRYGDLCKQHHPDRGGDETTMKWVNAAFSYLKSLYTG